MLCVCGSCCVLDVGFSYLDVFGKLKQRIHVANVACTCTQWFTYWAWKFIFGPWPFCFKLPTLISFFPPPSPMLHRSVVVEVVLWEPPRLHRLLYRPRFVGIGVVDWWGIVFEIKVTLYILDPLVLFFMYSIGPDPFCTTLKNDALCLRQLLCVGCRLQLLRCFWEVEAKETM
jgi:hypothetical protein